jgi:hypothetical protein
MLVDWSAGPSLTLALSAVPFVPFAAVEECLAVMDRGRRAVRLVDAIPGWRESRMDRLKLAFDLVSGRPTDTDSMLKQQLQAAAMSQGLLVPL